MNRREKLASWMAETHGGLFELTRHFLGESLSSELVSSPDHLQRLAIGVLAAIVSIGFVLPRVYYKKYEYLSNLPTPDLFLTAVRADRLFFLSLTMLLAGLATLLWWQSLFPSRRDYLVLRPLPVSLGDIFLARLLSVFLVLGVLTAGLLLMTCSFPLASSVRWQHPAGAQYLLAHVAGCAAGAWFDVCAAIAVQGLLLNLLPPRWFERLSLMAQILFLLVLLVAIPPAFSLPNLHREIAARPEWLAFLPSAWFLGLYERLLGNRDPYFHRLAEIAVRASLGAVTLSVSTYLVSYRRYASRAVAMTSGAAAQRWRVLGAACTARLFPQSLQQAVFGFTMATFRRSRHHKLLLTVYAGLALAFAVDSASAFLLGHGGRVMRHYEWQIMMQSVLAVPFIVSLLVVHGLAHAFRVPTEPRANWIFRLCGHEAVGNFLAPVAALVTAAAVLPVVVITPLATAYALGWRMAWLHTAFAAAIALLLAEFAIAEWNRIPFTCSYLAGRKPFFAIAGFAVGVFVFLAVMLTGIEAALLSTRAGMFVAITILLALYAWQVRRRQNYWREMQLVFDDVPEEMLTSLAIFSR